MTEAPPPEPPAQPTPRPTIEPAAAADAAEIARLHRAVRTTSLPWLPDCHSPAEDLVFFRDTVLPASRVFVARTGAIIGFIAARPGWIDHLYVAPAAQRRGIGQALLAIARTGQVELRLWTFQRNHAAIAFYTAQGFAEERRTDGHDNEEREPDVLMLWRAPRPPAG